MNTENRKSLMIAVLLQAIKDVQSTAYRAEVHSFLDSDGFVWLWEEVSEDVIGLPNAHMAREWISAGRVCISRSAYHCARNDEPCGSY